MSTEFQAVELTVFKLF